MANNLDGVIWDYYLSWIVDRWDVGGVLMEHPFIILFLIICIICIYYKLWSVEFI